VLRRVLARASENRASGTAGVAVRNDTEIDIFADPATKLNTPVSITAKNP
jgi:hypothetical protein